METSDDFDTGRWKEIRLAKRRDSLTLIVDRHKSVSMQVQKKLHLGRQVTIGGWHQLEGREPDFVSQIWPFVVHYHYTESYPLIAANPAF